MAEGKDEEIKLNQEQKRAVHYNKGPLLIVAGAGTGKTTVITEKIKYLIAQEKADTSQILALTFTDKAAREMERRVDIALPYGYTDIWVMTFHSFGDRILKDEALQIGLNSHYRLMSEADEVKLLKDHLFDLPLHYYRPLGNPTRFVDALIKHFSRLKDEDISPSEYLKWARHFARQAKRGKEEKQEAEKYLELAKAYQKYEAIKNEGGLMDFGDLISKVLLLFRKRPNVLREYQEKFRYILVDEFQDTNIAQYQLIKLLAPSEKNPHISVVSDDSQSIYKFRGAAVSNILQFKKDYPRSKNVVLIKNYRSGQKILDRAYCLIQFNNPDTLEVKLGISKNLKSVRGAGEEVGFSWFSSGDEEADWVAEKIKKLKKAKNLSWRDFAVLVRANDHSRLFSQALKYHQVPYQFLGPGALFKQSEVKDLIAYLLILRNVEDDAAWYRLLAMDIFNLPGRDLAVLSSFAQRNHLSYFSLLEMITGERPWPDEKKKPFLSVSGERKIKKIKKMVNRHLELVKKKETAGQILYYFLKDSGLLAAMAEVNSLSEQRRVQNISRFFDRLRQFEMDHSEATVQAVVDWLLLSQELGESPQAAQIDWEDEDRVNILTVHSAKGLEFSVVFLVNLVNGRFPSYRRREPIPIPPALVKEILPQGDYYLQEERRLFYVGMTRAKDYLFLTASRYYGEGKRGHRPSPFVLEALKKTEEELVSPQPKNHSSSLRFHVADSPLHYNKAEKIIPITSFSFTQISTFDHCPAQYRYAFLQRIPSPPTPAQDFGQVIHKTLFDFYAQIKRASAKKSKSLKASSFKKLLDLYRKNWRSVSFSNFAYEKRLIKEGEEMLKNFYEDSFQAEKKPLFLEKRFSFFLGKNTKVSGVFDRVDKDGDFYEIIDYKTGKAMKEKEAEKSLQMDVYALAAADPGILGVKPEKLKQTFYFLRERKKISRQMDRTGLEKARKRLTKKIEEMKRSDFSPRPGFWCDFCPYRIICDAWK